MLEDGQRSDDKSLLREAPRLQSLEEVIGLPLAPPPPLPVEFAPNLVLLENSLTGVWRRPNSACNIYRGLNNIYGRLGYINRLYNYIHNYIL